MGSDLKQGFISSLKSAWQTLNEFARAHTSSAQLQAELAIVANQIEEQEKQAEEGNFLWFVNLEWSYFDIVQDYYDYYRLLYCYSCLTQSIRSQRSLSHKKKKSLKWR